jgi:CheY-like chemotaxis protein
MARILVVDDHPDATRLIGLMFQRGHEVFSANCAAVALDMLRQQSVDLVIADQNMPEMTGEALLERVGLLFPRVARLMLTADIRVKNDPSRPYRVIYRPFKSADLRGHVARLLDTAGVKTA